MASEAEPVREAQRTLEAPGKLNLGLRILGRRPDGYHLLSSLFVPIELADELELRVAPGEGLELTVAGPSGVPGGKDNLAARAASSYLRASGVKARISITLRKRIPEAAGLGGGSSDCARVLAALAELIPSPVPLQLPELALGLGADVPFFLDPKPAWVGGIGERIEPARGIPRLPAVLARPRASLSTAAVFKAFARSPGASSALTDEIKDSRLSTGGALRELRSGDTSTALVERLELLLSNDLEEAASHLCPEISQLRRKLRDAGAKVVGLSGSGPTLYALFADREEARAFGQRLASRLADGERCWCTGTLPSDT